MLPLVLFLIHRFFGEGFKNDYIPDRGIENELNLIRLDKFTGDLSSFWQIRKN